MHGKHQIDQAIAASRPFGMLFEPNYSGVLSLFRRRYDRAPRKADVVVTGVPFDTAVTNRPGTRFGPRAVRAASSVLSWSGGPWRWPFDPFDVLDVVDAGDCDFDPGVPDKVPAEIEAHAARLLESGGRLLTLGGDHFVTYALLKAHVARHGPLALIQFDAHSDTWREDEKRIDHGTMFFHAVREGLIDPGRSVQIGIRSGNDETHGFTIIDADEVHDTAPRDLADRIAGIVGDTPAYLTFDIDCLDPAYAPGTGTPVCGGLTTAQAERILRKLTGPTIVGADVVEVSPPYDHAEITALAGATIALGIIGLWAHAKSVGR